uniref:Transposase (putative) gypsy type domain-containing protein n=1 Tax=Oryza brachyantha TaxID=4533 RepID=J3N232_ORYBR
MERDNSPLPGCVLPPSRVSSQAQTGLLEKFMPVVPGQAVVGHGEAHPSPSFPEKAVFMVPFALAGLVPPFSSSFYDVMVFYQIHMLHLGPNSILTVSIFAYLCEKFAAHAPHLLAFFHPLSANVLVRAVEASAATSGATTSTPVASNPCLGIPATPGLGALFVALRIAQGVILQGYVAQMKGIEEEWEELRKEWAKVEEAKAWVQVVADRKRCDRPPPTPFLGRGRTTGGSHPRGTGSGGAGDRGPSRGRGPAGARASAVRRCAECRRGHRCRLLELAARVGAGLGRGAGGDAPARAAACRTEERLANRKKAVAEREQRQLEAARELYPKEDRRRQELEVQAWEVGDLRRQSHELDAHERALQEAACSLPQRPGGDPDPILLEREAAIEALTPIPLWLRLESCLPMITASVEHAVEAARALGARIVMLDVRDKRDLGWYSLCLDQLAEGLRAIPAAVTIVTQRSSKDLAHKVAERILLSFSLHLSDFVPFLHLDDFPAGTDVEVHHHAVVTREIVAGFRGMAPKFSLVFLPEGSEAEFSGSSGGGDDDGYRG